MSGDFRQHLSVAAFALPATAFLLIVMALPLAGVFWQSIHDNHGFTLSAYAHFVQTPLFGSVIWTTMEISSGATLIAFILGYPVAYFLSSQPPRHRSVWIVFLLIPFWTSSLVKCFAFTVILGRSGFLNTFLGAVGLGPYKLLFNRISVMVAMSHYLLPFMVLPILANLTKQPVELRRVAATMGAGRLRTFLKVTFPLSLPGVISGALIDFTLALGFYVIPSLLGGPKDLMLSNLVDIYARQLIDFHTASVLATILTCMSLLATALLAKASGGATFLSERAD